MMNIRNYEVVTDRLFFFGTKMVYEKEIVIFLK